MEKNSEKALEIYNQFVSATSYIDTLELSKQIERCINFEEGRHFSMSKDLEDFPKITLNIIKQIGKTRKGNIMQNEYSYLVNTKNVRNIRKIQDFLKHLSEVTKLRLHDLQALDDDYKKGTAIGFFYYDAEKYGFMREKSGELRYEMIDIRNFRVANPRITDIQNQEWVMYLTREKKDSVMKKYGVTESDLVSDGNQTTFATEKDPITNKQTEELINIYTKFYRNKDGEVCYIVTTKELILKKETALNPYYTGDLTEMPNTMSVMDDKETKKIELKKKDKRNNAVWNMYPFVKLSFNKRDNDFYGIPIITEYIESQKSINNHFSVYDKALQDNVLGGWMYKDGAIDENELTTETGQMIAVKALPNDNIGNLLQRLPVANVPADSANYSQTLMGATRQVAGVSNVSLGQSDYAGQSAKQTQMLLQRVQENASDTAMMFNEFKKEQAMIMFLFAKFYYDNEEFVIIEHGNREDKVTEYLGDNSFKGEEFASDYVMIDMRVGTSPAFSEYNNIEVMGLALQSGQIPFEVYVNMLPEGYVSNKDELLKIAQNNSLRQIEALNERIKQYEMAMQQFSESYKEMDKDRNNIDTIIKENQQLKSEMAELIATTIKQNAETTLQNQEMQKDMRELLRIVNANKNVENN